MSAAASDDSSSVVSVPVKRLVKSLQMGFLLTLQNAPALLNDVFNLLSNTQNKDKHKDYALQFGRAKGIPALVAIMNQFPDDQPIQLQCCRILLVLAEKTENTTTINANWNRIGEAGGIVAILVAMLHHYDTTMQELGCQTLAAIGRTEETQEILVGYSGIEVVITAMTAYEAHGLIQAHGCHVFALLAATHPNSTTTTTATSNSSNTIATTNATTDYSSKVAALGGVKALLKALQTHPTDENVQLQACCAIRHLTADNDPNRGSIASGGGMEAILAAMRLFHDTTTSTILLENAVASLRNLIIGHKHNASTLMTLNGLSCVLTVMRKHNDALRIHEAGCGFLRYLADDDRNGERIGREGGITAILTAMRQFEDSSLIQQHGCAALCNLATLRDNVAPMVQAGGVGLIVAAMKKLADNVDVQKNGCMALQSLAMNEQNKISIAAGGGISVILAAMKCHGDNAAVQGLGIRALFDLAVNKRNMETIKSNDGIETVELARQTYPKNVYVQTVGKKILILLDPSRYSKDDGK